MQRIARGRRAAGLEHVLDKINPPPRTIEFVAQQRISRTRRRAQAAMYATAQDAFVFLHPRLCTLCVRKRRLHQTPAYMRPGLNSRSGSKLSFTRAVSAASAGAWGWKTSSRDRASSLARTSVAWPPVFATISLNRAAPQSPFFRHGQPNQSATPIQYAIGLWHRLQNVWLPNWAAPKPSTKPAMHRGKSHRAPLPRKYRIPFPLRNTKRPRQRLRAIRNRVRKSFQPKGGDRAFVEHRNPGCAGHLERHAQRLA